MFDQIYQGLRSRGLPDHIARGFLANFQVESGLNPGINEIAPLVPGSRGGFGLAQWTGPRRRQFEAFAGERGTRVDDLDTQLDFLMHELGTTEQSAAKSIFAAQTPEDATRAISEKFLRPGIPHLDRRLAALNGGGGTSGFMAGGEGNDRLGAPMQQDQEQRGAFGIKPELAMALAGGFYNLSRPGSGNQFLQNAYAMQARGERDAKTTKARNQTAEWLRGNGYGEFADLVEGGAVAAGDVMGAIMQQRLAAPKDNRTAALREYEFAKTQGYEGSFLDFQLAQKKAGATNISVGADGGIPDMNVDQGKNTGFLLRMEEAEGVLAGLESQGTRFGQQNLDAIPLGIGNYFRDAEFQQFDQARRDFINALMRRESGAVISPSEFDNAEKQYFPVPGDTPEVIEQKRRNRRAAIEGVRASSGAGAAYIDQLRDRQQTKGAIPDGIEPEVWEAMTPEERALFQ